jgi:uncharacterized SAM-binding protein YcdF (DUF218 family)
MFIELGQALSWFTVPANWLLIIQVLALALLFAKRYVVGSWLFAATVIVYFAFTQLPVAGMLMRPLEQAYLPPANLPEKIDGIVLLGGATDPDLTKAYLKPQLNSEAERLTEFMVLARRYPESRLVITGGSPRPDSGSDADVSRQFLDAQQFDTTKVLFERTSRTTYESAVKTYELVKPAANETWVLITSASHMPRGYGVFRKLGWNMIPYPVSYTVGPHGGPALAGTLDSAVHEWLGIAAYRMTGRM